MSHRRIVSNLILCLFSTFTFAQNSEILLKVGESTVNVEEFKYIYEKNNGKDADFSKASIQEYLELYKKFKLKVEKARQMKLDTVPALVEELNGYKRQLANSYLMEKDVMEFLLKQAFDRRKQDVRFSHIFIAIPANPSKKLSDNIEFKKAELSQKIKEGKPWDSLALVYSEDKNTAEKGGDMGFFTAMMPDGFYKLENVLYEAPLDSVVGPIQTKIGYHFVKVTERRPARGEIEVAQILLRDPENAESTQNIKMIHAKLKEGLDFGFAVKEFSQDSKSIPAGGLLPVFGIGQYEKSFEDAAFALQKDNDFSPPFKTSLGWHILKRVRKHEDTNYDRFKKFTEAKLKNDERYVNGKNNLLTEIRKNAYYNKNEILYDKFLATLNDEFFSYRWIPVSESWMKEPLFTLGGNFKVSVDEFADYARKNTRIRLRYDKNNHHVREPLNVLYDQFLEEKTLDFEIGNLENKYADFRSLMREYEEGILLFEATKEVVWDRANQDSIGLEKFFKENQSKYMNPKTALVETYTISGSNAKTAAQIQKLAAKKGMEDVQKKFNKKTKIVEVTSREVTEGEGLFQDLPWKINSVSAIVNTNGVYTFEKIALVNEPRPKALNDARGYVIADYQDFLEKEWVSQLSKEFEIVVHDNVLESLIKK